MRRLTLTFLVAAAAAALLAAGAAAKEGGVELSSAPPYGLDAGDKWTTTLRLIDGTPEMLKQAKPRIEIENGKTGDRSDFAATPTDKPGVYTVDVVFPHKGFWTYSAYDGVTGRAYEFPVVYIDGPAGAPAGPVAPAADTDSLPAWPFITGGIAFVVLVLAAALALRQRRFGLQH
jgi:hypothetical protein